MNHQQRKELVLRSQLFSILLLHKRSNASGANHRPGCFTMLYGCCMESVWVFLVFVFFVSELGKFTPMNRALQSKSPHQVTHCKLASLQKQAYKSKSKVSLPLSVAATGWLWHEGKASQESLKSQIFGHLIGMCVCVCIPKCKWRQKFQSEAKHSNIPNSVTKGPCRFTKNDTRLWSSHGACRAWQWLRRASFKQWTSTGFKCRQQQNWWFTLIEIQWQMQGGKQPTSICTQEKMHLHQNTSNSLEVTVTMAS